MAIKGSLREASLPDVLQLLAMGKKTGCLGLTHHDSYGCIYFDSGRICHAEVANSVADTENAVYSLFTWPNGTFNFEPGVLPGAGTALTSLDPQSILLEGARRVDEWTLIEKKIPSFDAVFTLDRQGVLLNKLPLAPEQEILLPLIDGNRDVNALVRDSRLTQFDAGKALYGLISAGFAVPVGRAARPDSSPRDASPAERRGLGVSLYKAGMYADAERELRALGTAGERDAVAMYYLGLLALRRLDWSAAVGLFQDAAPGLPVKAALLHNLAFAYERLGQLEKARLLQERAVRSSARRDPCMYLQVGIIALRAGEVDAAKRALAEARSLWTSSSPPAVWFHYAALASAASGDPTREMLLLGAGTEAYPGSAVLLSNLAVANAERGQYREARDLAGRALAISPDLPQPRRILSEASSALSSATNAAS